MISGWLTYPVAFGTIKFVMLSVEHSTIETLKKRFDGNVGVLVVMGQNPGTLGTLSCLMDGYSPIW